MVVSPTEGRTVPSSPLPLRFNLIVLRCADLHRARVFYEALGFRFVDEKHGDGPPHLSSSACGVVLELYPRQDRDSSGVRIGIGVPDLPAAVRACEGAGGTIRRRPDADGSPRAVVVDPDGHTVELCHAPTDLVAKVCRIPLEFKSRGDVSLRWLMEDSGYPNAPESLTLKAVEETLSSHPELVDAWELYSTDKRIQGGWYVRQKGGTYEICETRSEERLTQVDRARAYAEFVVREMRWLVGIRSEAGHP